MLSLSVVPAIVSESSHYHARAAAAAFPSVSARARSPRATAAPAPARPIVVFSRVIYSQSSSFFTTCSFITIFTTCMGSQYMR